MFGSTNRLAASLCALGDYVSVLATLIMIRRLSNNAGFFCCTRGDKIAASLPMEGCECSFCFWPMFVYLSRKSGIQTLVLQKVLTDAVSCDLQNVRRFYRVKTQNTTPTFQEKIDV